MNWRRMFQQNYCLLRRGLIWRKILSSMKKKADPLYLIPNSGVKVVNQAVFNLPHHLKGIRITAEWVQTPGIIVDLDVAVFIYDERARLVERLSADNLVSLDQAVTLEADVEDAEQQEFVQVLFEKIDPAVSCVVLFLDGGARNFQHVQGLHVNIDDFTPEDTDRSFLMISNADQANIPAGICHMLGRTRNNCHGATLMLLYKSFDSDNGSFSWSVRNIFESTYCTNQLEKDAKVQSLIICGNVPALDKYRPRLFPNVGSICSKLSSKALPKLKDKFAGPGLPLDQFVETIFKELLHVTPQLNDQIEADYLVAMLYDMFGQIDLNGDGSVDWDEFTSFTVSTGVAEAAAEDLHAGSDLDHYTIEYTEDLVTFKCPLHTIMREVHHVPSLKRIIVVPEGSSKVFLYDERGNKILNFLPAKAQASLIPQMSDQNNKVSAHGHSSEDKRNALIVYDAIYLEGRHLLAYTASDHTIGVCREKRVLEGQKPEFVMHNKIIYHQMLHSKLCWSKKYSILCSVANDNNIYGWDIDTAASLFVVSRHTDTITDMLALDNRDCFMTCSHDKRIVLWSMQTRRVKGVLAGHKTGVKCISVEGDILLSAGFECDAMTWDLNSKEKSLILRGHRFPLVAARLMCDYKATGDEARAITADESGELRLWNVYVNEKVPDVSQFAPVLQTFSMNAGKPPENKFHSFVFPFDSRFSKGCYSNILAFSTRLVQFTPEKNARAFQPPTCAAFNESTGCVAVAVSTNLLKYEIATGHFLTAFNNVSNSELTAVCFDDIRGRKIYVGTNGGDIILLNFSTGVELFSDNIHRREITCLYSEPDIETPGGETVNMIVSGSLDGYMRALVEEDGELVVHHTADSPFGYGDHSGVGQIRGMTAQRLLVVSSLGNAWTVWNLAVFKRLMLRSEESAVLDIEIVLDYWQQQEKLAHDAMQGISVESVKESPKPKSRKKDSSDIVTVAVGMMSGIMIYSFSVADSIAVRTFKLTHTSPIMITSLTALYCSRTNTVNYSSGRATDLKIGSFLIVSCDDGAIVGFELEDMQKECIEIYRRHSKPHLMCNLLKKQSNSFNFLTTPLEQEEEENGMDSTTCTSALSVPRPEVPVLVSVKGAGGSKFKALGQKLKTLQLAQNLTNEILASGPSTARSVTEPSPLLKQNARIGPTEFEFLGLEENHEWSSTVEWSAHSDSITESLPLHKDGCFVSVSHDGFIRVWNIDKECLGEKMLTNLTDGMKEKAMLTGRGAVWKFIQERIAVTEYHQKVAKRLVRLELGLDPPRPLPVFHKRISATLLPGMLELGINHPLHEDAISPIDMQKKRERDVLRSEILGELSTEGSVGYDEGSFADFMSDKTQHKEASSKVSTSISKAIGDDASTVSTITAASISPIRGRARRSPQKIPRELWEVIGDAGGASGVASLGPLAFSEASLSESHHSNLIDGEGHALLRKFAKHKSDAEVFDKIIPDIYLRNPKMTASVKIPKLKAVKAAEVVFGKQQKLYKNASNVYSNRYNSMQTRIRTRHQISMNKIHQNIKAIGSMVHVQPKCVLDDVLVPPSTEIPSPRDLPVPYELPTIDYSRTPLNERSKTGDGSSSDEEKSGRMGTESDFFVHDITDTSSSIRPVSTHFRGVSTGENSFDTVSSFGGEFGDDLLPHTVKVIEPDRRRKSELSLFEQGAFYSSADSMGDEGDNYDSDLASVVSLNSKLDTKRISNLMRKISVACDISNIPEWERQLEERAAQKREKKKHKRGVDTSNNKLVIIEKKLAHAVRQVARIILGSQVVGLDCGRGMPLSQPKPLTNRALMPFYTLHDVNKFILIFNKVDADFSGSLDADEWTQFFTNVNKSVTVQEAQVLFTKMDKNDDGDLSISELLPLVFSKATKEQLRSILYYCQREIVCKKEVLKGRKILESEDLDELFNFYDSDLVGFVAVSTIRDRVKGFDLPRQAEEFILRSIEDLQDDEMVNPTEFHRIFEPCLTKSLEVSEAISQLEQRP